MADIVVKQEDIESVSTNITSDNLISYGSLVQSKTNEIASEILKSVKVRKVDDNNLVTDLVQKIKSVDVDNRRKLPFISKFFNRLERYIIKASNVLTEVEVISNKLKSYLDELHEDHVVLGDFFQSTKITIEEMFLLIKGLEHRISLEKKELTAENMRLMDEETLKDKNNFVQGMDFKLQDLKITTYTLFQTLSQIRVLQENNKQLIMKTDAIFNTTLPIWKNSIAMYIAVQKQRKVTEVHKHIRTVTNTMIANNAKYVRETTLQIQEESNHTTISVETIRSVHKELMELGRGIQVIQEKVEESRRRFSGEMEVLNKEQKYLIEQQRTRLIGSSKR